MMDRLLMSNIKQVNRAFNEKSLKASELTQQCLQRAKQINKELNAFVRITHKEAEEQSYEIDNKNNRQLCTESLEGIPIAIKDNFCVKNVTTTCSSHMLEKFVPPYDATVYERLKAAGAILIGKTNLDQFGMGSGTVDSIHGATRNPYPKKTVENKSWRIAGGSSGGSAVAVATGACFAALGSDTGGSTRNPASYCGVVGLKPTYGLISRHGLIPLVNSMDVPGILTRTVDDCCIVLNCLAGPDIKDSTTIKSRFSKFSLPENPDLKGIRIGIPVEYHCEGMSSEVSSLWTKVADLMEDTGAKVKQVSLPNTKASISVYSILNQCEVSSNMSRYDGIEYGLRATHSRKNTKIESTEELYAESRAQGFNSVVRNRIIAGNYFLLQRNYDRYFQKAMKVRRLIANDFNRVFHGDEADTVDILLTPTTLSEAPFYGDFIQKNNRDQCAIQDFCTQPANMAGIPAISVPITLSSNMMPLSLQLMGPNLSEERLLRVAKWLEHTVKYPYC